MAPAKTFPNKIYQVLPNRWFLGFSWGVPTHWGERFWLVFLAPGESRGSVQALGFFLRSGGICRLVLVPLKKALKTCGDMFSSLVVDGVKKSQHVDYKYGVSASVIHHLG